MREADPTADKGQTGHVGRRLPQDRQSYRRQTHVTRVFTCLAMRQQVCCCKLCRNGSPVVVES